MKKLIIAVVAVIAIHAGAFAQTAVVKKTEPSKIQLAKKQSPKNESVKMAVNNKTSKPAATTAKATAATTVKKQSSSHAAKTSNATGTKKSTTAQANHVANKNLIAKASPQHLKKDGTPDKRYKENKKHS